MQDLDEIINEATEAREVKRAVSVKMGRQGFSAAQICRVLNVSPQYVSKWKGQYEAEGAVALRLGHRGSEGYWGRSNGRRLFSGLRRTRRCPWKRCVTTWKKGMVSSINPNNRITSYWRPGA